MKSDTEKQTEIINTSDKNVNDFVKKQEHALHYTFKNIPKNIKTTKGIRYTMPWLTQCRMPWLTR